MPVTVPSSVYVGYRAKTANATRPGASPRPALGLPPGRAPRPAPSCPLVAPCSFLLDGGPEGPGEYKGDVKGARHNQTPSHRRGKVLGSTGGAQRGHTALALESGGLSSSHRALGCAGQRPCCCCSRLPSWGAPPGQGVSRWSLPSTSPASLQESQGLTWPLSQTNSGHRTILSAWRGGVPCSGRGCPHITAWGFSSLLFSFLQRCTALEEASISPPLKITTMKSQGCGCLWVFSW